MTLFPTNAFRHLHKKGLLRSYLESLGLEGDLQLSEALPRSVQKQLQEAGLAVEQSERPAVGLPFEIVQALNFELTYGCNLACTHCLQDGLRPPNKSFSWADLASVERALREAKMLGLATEGVNFTGGEILVKDSPVLTLVRLAASLDIHVRVNTNATWGKKEGICIGSEHFATDIDVVRTFKEAGAMILALSLDDRYSTYQLQACSPDRRQRGHQHHHCISTRKSKLYVLLYIRSQGVTCLARRKRLGNYCMCREDTF